MQINKQLSCKDYKKSPETGFSLTELLVVIVMFSIIATAGYSLFKEQTRINIAQQNILEMQSSGRAALQALIHSISHAGFGTSYSKSDFIKPTYSNATSGNSDSIILSYGSQYVSKVTANATETNIITVDDTTLIATGDEINFFPSLNPNKTYIASPSGTSSITLDEEVILLLNGTKIFKINNIEFSHNSTSEILYQNNVPLIYDVASFQLAYTQDDKPADWKNKVTEEKIKGIWIYLLLKTKNREAGFKESKTFTLPWDTAEQVSSTLIRDGFHYQEFQTQVWLRNAK